MPETTVSPVRLSGRMPAGEANGADSLTSSSPVTASPPCNCSASNPS
jgi:hypothetical protein